MRRYTSVGLSPLVAVILLIAITVAAAVVVSGVFFNLAGIAGRRPTAVIDQIKLLNATGGGVLTVVLKNTGDVSIAGNPRINMTYPVDGCNPTSTVPTWGGNRDPGATMAATVSITGCTTPLLGRTIQVRVTVDFIDGSRQILSTGATAGLA